MNDLHTKMSENESKSTVYHDVSIRNTKVGPCNSLRKECYANVILSLTGFHIMKPERNHVYLVYDD